MIHEAAFRGRFDLEATQAAMARANGRRNLAVLESALAAHASGSAGTRSSPEDAFLEIASRTGLPRPLVNVEVLDGIEVDFHWPELRLCVEVDGPGHARPRTQLDDEARDRRLRAAGYEVRRLVVAR